VVYQNCKEANLSVRESRQYIPGNTVSNLFSSVFSLSLLIKMTVRLDVSAILFGRFYRLIQPGLLLHLGYGGEEGRLLGHFVLSEVLWQA
jgi:hypothetical protein